MLLFSQENSLQHSIRERPLGMERHRIDENSKRIQAHLHIKELLKLLLTFFSERIQAHLHIKELLKLLISIFSERIEAH